MVLLHTSVYGATYWWLDLLSARVKSWKRLRKFSAHSIQQYTLSAVALAMQAIYLPITEPHWGSGRPRILSNNYFSTCQADNLLSRANAMAQRWKRKGEIWRWNEKIAERRNMEMGSNKGDTGQILRRWSSFDLCVQDPKVRYDEKLINFTWEIFQR